VSTSALRFQTASSVHHAPDTAPGLVRVANGVGLRDNGREPGGRAKRVSEGTMKLWRLSDDKAERYLDRLEQRQRAVLTGELDSKARRIVEAVAKRGDKALVSFVRRYDLAGVSVSEFRLKGQLPGGEQVGEDFVAAVELAIQNLTAFHEPQVPHGYTHEQAGGEIGIRVRPLESVGVYVPGGNAAYVSSLLMAVIPARLAGVQRIAVATPPAAFLASPHLRYVLERLDLGEVYLMGGAHAVAALAFGTESVTPVDKIVGPGGRWVAAAKRCVVGVVDVDHMAGPPEAVVLADGHAEPELVAADMLAQAEHDASATVLLISTSKGLAERVDELITRRLRSLPRGAAARAALKDWGAILLAEDLDEALVAVNRLAPEHVTLMVEDPRRLLDGIEHAGAIYLGPWSSSVLGDYVMGSNHILPTSGTARFASPLGVWDFIHRTAVVRVAAHTYPPLAKAARALALHEELPLHAEALRAGRRGRV
jgi:histidinol dehydrogenase